MPNVVIILNPNGTVNEELMLAHGMNLETIKAVTEQGINLQVRRLKMLQHLFSKQPNFQAAEIGQQTSDPNTSIKSLQHPLPRRDLIDVKPLFANQVRCFYLKHFQISNKYTFDSGRRRFPERWLTTFFLNRNSNKDSEALWRGVCR